MTSLPISNALHPTRWLTWWSLVIAAVVAVPVVSVATSLFNAGTGGTWAHLVATLLPEYLMTSLVLCVGVGVGVALLGVGAAWLVTHLDFFGRRHFEWLLVLPLAMPAYVMAYTYTDLLQFAGPVQRGLRDAFGWSRADYWFPDVRSTGGAVAMFICVLYPYVYMLARTAFLERGGGVMEAGRSLGLTPWQSFLRLSVPMARPAIAAGVALSLMETLADYGTVSYFAVQTFTTGIYRAWFSLGDRAAAAQLSMCLLGFVLLVLALERLSRGRARYHGPGLRPQPPRGARLRGWRAALAFAACCVPLLMGFLLPSGVLLHMALTDGDAQFGARFFELARNSLVVSGLTAAIAVTLALLVAYARRLDPGPIARSAHWAAGMGYALPGSVIAVGVLIPVARLDNALALWLRESFGWQVGLLITGSIAALVFACVVRFLTAALQTVDSALHRVTPHMDDAARSLGLTPARTLMRVHVPLLRRGLLTAGLLVFIDVMKELPATLVMRPFNFDTLATQAYRLASDERLAEASTASLAIVVVGLLPMIVLCRQIAKDRG
ncbi:iron ABC transporter permease [Piscinibacter gummiphilus]|uniref:Iron ABC transporter permease n=1 Tax=Piscinibacter gummiphilus TaxID=946333 RepID=A0ABZ0CX04_9BURK|nr:iron ABC transporter permease [Piscinibacter gummiphilus]WOB09496.1 iron ABC transporter permease [Piscinibacter gummiphilus]